MRITGTLLALVIASGAADALAGTFLHVEGEIPGSPGVREVTLSSADGAWTAAVQSAPGLVAVPGSSVGVTIFVNRRSAIGDTPVQWQLFFATPGATLDAPPRPGVYEHATSDPFATDAARLQVEAGFVSCLSDPGVATRATGRFVVHEAVYDPAGVVLTFAADFALRCADGTQALHGAVRFNAGDVACAQAADGAACDDRNPCSDDDRCRAGTCAGTTQAACVPDTCEDGDLCTDDVIENDGRCAHQPIAGTCWRVAERSSVTATALGRTCRCALPRGIGELALREDGTFQEQTGVIRCQSADVPAPVEVGTWSPGRRRRLALRTTNGAEIGAISAACASADEVVIRRDTTWVKLLAGNTRLRGAHHVRARSRSGPSVGVQVVSRWRGVPVASAPLRVTTPTDVAAVLAPCVAQLTACFAQP